MNRRFAIKLPPFISEIVTILILGAGFMIFRTVGEMDPVPAALLAIVIWLISRFAFVWIMRWAEVPPEDDAPGWDGLDCDKHFHRERLQLLFDRYGVTGSMNVRCGRIYPVVNPDLLSPLAKRLRASVALVRGQTKALDLFYIKHSHTELADLTIMEVEQAASVIEREVEDRNSSRKLYRGFGEEEKLNMARSVVANLIRNAKIGDGNDPLIIAQAIRNGQHDDHPMMQVATSTIATILSVKGTDV